MIATRAQPRRRVSLQHREAITGYLFILPALLGFVLWYVGPMLYSFWISLHEWDLLSPPEWAGLGNYRRMWNDPLFTQSLKVTFKFVVISVPLVQIVGFAIAMLLNMKVRGQAVFRTIYYLPTIAPLVAGSVLWMWIFNSDFGLLNDLLRQLGFKKILWLQEPRWALWVIILFSVWGFGSTMVVYLAGLQGVPQELYEAAALDGARFRHRLFDVTIPMMSPVILFNTLLGIVFAFQRFTEFYLLSNRVGSPHNSTLVYSLFLFRQAFISYRMGYAAALAWVLFIIVLVISLIGFRLARGWVYYEVEGQ
ncbi:MAG: carbohydrate ABC transporter permease [Thermomicrobiales bacterium]